MTTDVQSDGEVGPLRILKAEIARTAALLSDLVQPGTSVLGNAVPHLTSCRGKMMRPLLTLASGHAASALEEQTVDRCVRAAAAVEMLHVGTLCHDDVIDKAETRRGTTSVNAEWGNTVAILAGDVLISRAIRTVAELGPAETGILAQTLEDLCEGQAMETASLFDVTRSRADYLRGIELKTASLFAASCQLGSLCAGADPQRAEEFATFGRVIGVAFQIVDDVLDLVGSEEILGKPPGSDLQEGVLTLPVIDALQRAPELYELLAARPSPAQAERAREIIVECGAVGVALAEARSYLDEGRQVLSGMTGVHTHYVAALIGLAESVLERGLVGAHTTIPEPLLDVVRQWTPSEPATAAVLAGIHSRGGNR